MNKPMALRGRAKLATLLNSLLHRSAQGREGKKEPDPRNLKTWRQFLLGVIAKRSTRLMAVGQAVAPWRRVGSVKSAAMALGYFLEKARFPMRSFPTRLLETAVLMLGSDRLESYRGKVVLVIDPTEYAVASTCGILSILLNPLGPDPSQGSSPSRRCGLEDCCFKVAYEVELALTRRAKSPYVLRSSYNSDIPTFSPARPPPIVPRARSPRDRGEEAYLVAPVEHDAHVAAPSVDVGKFDGRTRDAQMQDQFTQGHPVFHFYQPGDAHRQARSVFSETGVQPDGNADQTSPPAAS
mgnify:CR=1 FL=1